MENNSKGLSIGALVCGIVSVVFSFIYVWIGLITGVVAIVLAVNGRKKAPKGQTGMATAGLVLGIVGTSLSALMFICAACIVGTAINAINGLNY